LRTVSDPDRFDILGPSLIGSSLDDLVLVSEESVSLGISPMADLAPRPEALDRFCIAATRPQVRQRAVALAAAVGISAHGPAPSLPLLPAAGEPLPCRLSTQDLVELLKMPTCVGDVRRVILGHLGNRYRRRFDTHWDFVRYAQVQGLDLDFTTPPKRPAGKLPPLFEE
jgi:hypothetical protein